MLLLLRLIGYTTLFLEPNILTGTQIIQVQGPQGHGTEPCLSFPIGFSTPSLTVQINADNVATVFLNGVQTYQQAFAEIFENFQDPPESFTVTDPSLFHAGVDILEFEIYNFAGQTAFDYKAIVFFTPVFQVAIDIKPGSFPNSINLGSKGVVPVAVLTTTEFDASTVDPDTVKFAGADPVRWAMEDVDGDGDMDMVFHFATADLAQELDENSTQATLTGSTYGGQAIAGTDTVNIVPK